MDAKDEASKLREPLAPAERSTRVDMHCHSSASQISKLGMQRAVGLPVLRARLAHAGLESVRARTWEQALDRLGAGYRRVLSSTGSAEVAHAA